ncbi:A/G-specific adenine glycosylase [Halobacteriales archaeon QS_9_70_65]|nr:MAG: A/G-specific adenine glycosylase [Halobacteriales archaeon QS_9_70_65]
MTDAVDIAADVEVGAVRTALLEWYDADHRAFPWRETTDPYRILVSEVMSQQTGLDRVVDAYEEFLAEWPTVEDLAAADRAEVVAFWTDHSLGYNNRAKYLHEAAGEVVDGMDSAFPRSPDGLQELMGVGPYTADAVASFAFNDGGAVVDTNVERVLYRAFDVEDDDEAFEAVAAALMPDGESRRWNNAIMELGGVACEKTPRCDEAGCPWRRWCDAYETGDFTAPDVPTQPKFEGSRRQMRGRVVSVLTEFEELALDELGPRVRVDYTPKGVLAGGEGSSEEGSESDGVLAGGEGSSEESDDSGGEHGREWLRGLVADLEDDGLVEVESRDGEAVVWLRR